MPKRLFCHCLIASLHGAFISIDVHLQSEGNCGNCIAAVVDLLVKRSQGDAHRSHWYFRIITVITIVRSTLMHEINELTINIIGN